MHRLMSIIAALALASCSGWAQNLAAAAKGEPLDHRTGNDTVEKRLRNTILPVAPFLGWNSNVHPMDVWPWLEWMSKELDVEGWGGVRFVVRVEDPRPRGDRNTMRDWYGADCRLQAHIHPAVVNASLGDYVEYVARANGWTMQVTDEAVVIRAPEQKRDAEPKR